LLAKEWEYPSSVEFVVRGIDRYPHVRSLEQEVQEVVTGKSMTDEFLHGRKTENSGHLRG
jgi:hypothetical protein